MEKEKCLVPDCPNPVTFDDWGIQSCEKHITEAIGAYNEKLHQQKIDLDIENNFL